MDTALASQAPIEAKSPKTRPKTSATLRQAIDVQRANHRAVLAISNDFSQCTSTAERMVVAESLARLTASWKVATAERREIHNRPRAGSLSPAERAAMRQKKSQRSTFKGPTLAKPAPSDPGGHERNATARPTSNG